MDIQYRHATTQEDREKAARFINSVDGTAALEALLVPNMAFVLAEESDNLVGATAILVNGPTGYDLQSFWTAVAPGYRGLHIPVTLTLMGFRGNPGETICAYVANDALGIKKLAQGTLQGSLESDNGVVSFYASTKSRVRWP